MACSRPDFMSTIIQKALAIGLLGSIATLSSSEKERQQTVSSQVGNRADIVRDSLYELLDNPYELFDDTLGTLVYGYDLLGVRYEFFDTIEAAENPVAIPADIPTAGIGSRYGPNVGMTTVLDLMAIDYGKNSLIGQVVLLENGRTILRDNSLGQQLINLASYSISVNKNHPETVTYTLQVIDSDGNISQANSVVTFSGRLEDRVPGPTYARVFKSLPTEPLGVFIQFSASDSGDRAAIDEINLYKNEEKIVSLNVEDLVAGQNVLRAGDRSISGAVTGLGENSPDGAFFIRKEWENSAVYKIEYVDRGGHKVYDFAEVDFLQQPSE